MTLKLTNTLTKQKEIFEPLSNKTVSFYHCGPTVYWTQHIGNLRAMVLADCIRKSLELFGYTVMFVRNYTDVGHLTGDNLGDADLGEDKMAVAASREQTTPELIAEKYIAQFENDTKTLHIQEPTYTPRATDMIAESIEMTQILLKNGFAYTTDLAIYFDITKVKDYTKLSKQNLTKQQAHAGAGAITDPQKKNPQDFALWFFKAGTHEHALQTWPSPFTSSLAADGQGFPGWHIECSVMAKKFLGDTIDIHMGGIEHIPVHHTNEIAQSESANGKPFVRYWLHNEHLLVDNKKMSKSEGTSYVLDDILNKGFDPLALRYFYLQAHYRSKQNFTWEALTAAQTALHKLYIQTSELPASHQTIDPLFKKRFIAALEDDNNIPQALAVTWELLKSDIEASSKTATVYYFDQVLGLDIRQRSMAIQKITSHPPAEVKKLLAGRNAARDSKDWVTADALREKIQTKGFWLQDTSEGTIIIPKL